MSERMTGGCQCGRVRYAVQVEEQGAELCHCRMCERATGGLRVALKQVARGAVTWTREPDLRASSPIARRGLRAGCGMPPTFDDPTRFRSTRHSGWGSRHAAWLDTAGLPHRRDDEYQPLVAGWEKVRDE